MERNCGKLFIVCCIVCIAVAVSGCNKSSVQKPSAEPAYQKANLGPKIVAKCIVTYYDGKDSKYVTEQTHTIYPDSFSIAVNSNEPEGNYKFSLIKGKSASTDLASRSNIKLCTSEIAQAIAVTVAASGGFIGNIGSVQDPVSIAGRMYNPVLLSSKSLSSDLKIYCDLSSKTIEWVEVYNSSDNARIISRNYNIRNIKDSEKSMPTSIDIYKADNPGMPDDRIMNIEYKSYKLIPGQQEAAL